MPRNGARDTSDSTDTGFKPSRRSYIKAAGAAAVSVPLLAGEGAAATERHGISFDNVVEVDDAGEIESAADDDTLLKFSSGTYDLSDRVNVHNKSNFGIVGEGDVTFTVPDDYDGKILNINGGTSVLVENITIDQSNATPCVQVAPDDDLQVHGLEMRGEGISSATSGHGSGGSEAIQAFSPMVRSSGGSGMVKDIVLHNEGRMGAYSRVGVWIGEASKGTITLRDCNVEGFSGNGIYGSRTPGEVHVEGGLYKNNDLSQVRIGSNGSYVDGVSAVVDTSESRSDNPGEMLNGSGIRIESDRGGSGAVVRNCDISIGSNANADSGIKVFGNYSGNFTVENTRIEVDCAGYGLRASTPDDSSGDTSATLENVSVTGDATSLVGILIEGRDGSTIEDSCVQSEGSRKGVFFHNCDDSSITNTSINAGGKGLQLTGSDVTQSISSGGSCATPNISSSGYSGSSVSSVADDSSSDDSSSDDSGSDDSSSDDSSSDSSSDDSSSDDSSSDSSSDDSSSEDSSSDDSSSDDSSSDDSSSDDSSSDDSDSDDSSSDDSSGNSDGAGSDNELSGDIDESDVPEPSDNANLLITDTSTEGGRIPYEFTTSGDLEKAGTSDATQDDNDDISDNTATGGVQSYRDAYEYEGELVALEVEDHATIKLDDDAGTITVMGEEGSSTDYSLEVTGTLEHADDSRDPISDDGSSVSGGVGSFRDEYTYTGSLVQASIENSVSITTDPETLDE